MRELRSALRFAIALSDDAPVSMADLPDELCADQHIERPRSAAPAHRVCIGVAVPQTADSEGDASARLLNALKHHKWNVTRAADELALCRATIYRQMKRFGITPPNQL